MPLRRLRGGGIGATLARGAGGVFVVTSIGQALMFGLLVLLARLLGLRDYGIFAYALSWINILLLLSKLGFDTALIRFVAAFQATGEFALLRGILIRANQLALAASLVVISVAALVVVALGDRVGDTARATFLLSFLALPLLTLATLRYAALRGLKKVVLAQLPERIIRPALTGVFVLGTYVLLDGEVSAPMAMLAYLSAISIAFVVGEIWLRRNLPHQVAQATPEYRTTSWLRTSLSLLLVSGSFVLVTQTDTIMVGALLDSDQAGIYFSANRLTILIQFGIIAVQQIAAPMVASFHATGKRRELQRTLSLAALGASLVAIPASIALAALSGTVLSIFGTAFVAGERALWILVAAQGVNAVTGMTGLVMTMTGHQAIAARVIGVCALGNIALNLLLIPSYGLVGAAIATLVTTLAWNSALVYYAWKRLGLWTLPLPRRNQS